MRKSFREGDKVYGITHGLNPNQAYDGVAAEYAVVIGNVAMHVLEGKDWEDLSTVGLRSIAC